MGKLIGSVLALFLLLNLHNVSAKESGDSTQAVQTILIARSKSKSPIGIRSTEKTKATKYKPFTNIKYSGYARAVFGYRDLPVRYSNLPTAQKLVNFNGYDFINGQVTGYQEPLLLVRLEGAPTSKTYFRAQMSFNNQMLGIEEGQATTVASFQSSNGANANFTAGINTKIGDFSLTTGSFNWTRLSPFTLWNFEYRDDMFERYPWEPEGAAFGRYDKFYVDQNIARDLRWGNIVTQGFILDGINMPGGFGFRAFYGKSPFSGSYQSYLTRIPKNTAAGRIDKGLGKHKVGINFISEFGYTDSTARYKARQQIVTADARINFQNIKIYVEAGVGKFQNWIMENDGYLNLATYVPKANYPNQTKFYKAGEVAGINYDWGHCFNINADFAKALTKIPFSLQLYSISKNVVNTNSMVLNSANPHAVAEAKNVNEIYDITTFQGVITDIGQMTNNRSGVNLKHESTYGKLKLMAAVGVNQEIENLFDTISFQHRANAFNRSKFGYFQGGLGPYTRLSNVFRRTFEKIGITDSISDYKKGFTNLDFSLKYKFKVFARDLIVSNYNNYNSVQEGISLPQFGDKAFVRTFYEELMIFYALAPKFSFISFVSYERNIGNMRTSLADAEGNLTTSSTGKPMDQTGYGYGFGLDYDISGRAGLYLRQRWFQHEDKNFTKDKFKGSETTLEFKVFF